MFEAKLELKEKADILRLRGEFAIDAVEKMKGITLKLAERDRHPLIVDMSGLKFIDSRGAAFLVSLKFKMKGKKIILAGPQKEVRRVLIRLFLMDQFTICKSVREAWRKIPLITSGLEGAM